MKNYIGPPKLLNYIQYWYVSLSYHCHMMMSYWHSCPHCNHEDDHHEDGCMRVDAGLGRHQSLSRNLVNPCLSRYITLHFPCATIRYIPLHFIPLCYNTRCFPALHCFLTPAKPPCTSLLCKSLCFIMLHCELLLSLLYSPALHSPAPKSLEMGAVWEP